LSITNEHPLLLWASNQLSCWGKQCIVLLLRELQDVSKVHLYESPTLHCLHNKVFLWGKCFIPICVTPLSSPLVQVSIQPQSKFSTAKEQENKLIRKAVYWLHLWDQLKNYLLGCDDMKLDTQNTIFSLVTVASENAMCLLTSINRSIL